MEFALIAPVLILMLVGVLMYGLYFGAASSVQQLAADAARASVAGVSDTERARIARDHVTRFAGEYMLIDAGKTSVTAGPAAGDPNVFRVAVAYDARGLAFWSLDGLLPLPDRVITRAAAIRRGGY